MKGFDAIKKSPYADLFIPPDDNNDIDCKMLHYRNKPRMLWYETRVDTFKPQPNGKIVTYITPPSYHYLHRSFKVITLPEMRIKNEYAETFRFRWDDDIGYKVSPLSSFEYNGVRINHKDMLWDIMASERHIDPGCVKRHKKDVGNSKELAQWSHYHKKVRLQPEERWCYSEMSEMSFPLWKLASIDKLEHIYTYNLEIPKLIRMQQRINGKWTKIKPRMDVFTTNETLLKMPALYGVFTRQSPYEESFHEDLTASGDNSTNEYYISDVVIADKKNKLGYNSTKSVSIKTLGLIRAVHICAENAVAKKYNNACNLTWNSDDHKCGDTPISHVTIKNALDENILKEMPSSILAGVLGNHHFKNSPKRNGILSYAFSNRLNEHGIDVGELSPIEISCYFKTDDPDADQNDKFLLKVRALIMRVMVFVDGTIRFPREGPDNGNSKTTTSS